MEIICGVDEAGRGPLVGPVVAGAVILPNEFDTSILNDSKKLTANKREIANKIILKNCLYGLGVISHKTIDRVNILQATMIAMKKAVFELLSKAHDLLNITIIIDGNKVADFCDIEKYFGCKIAARAVVKADAKIPSVMAASIIAKVKRDNIMKKFDEIYPGYNWAQNKGYPTPAHKALIKKLGISPIARRTFRFL